MNYKIEIFIILLLTSLIITWLMFKAMQFIFKFFPSKERMLKELTTKLEIRIKELE